MRHKIDRQDPRVRTAIKYYVQHLLIECEADRGDLMANAIQRLSALLHECYEVSLSGAIVSGNWTRFYQKYFSSATAHAVTNGFAAKEKLCNEHVIPMNLLCYELRERYRRGFNDPEVEICKFVERYCMVCILTDGERKKVDKNFRRVMPQHPWNWEGDPLGEVPRLHRKYFR